MWLIETMSSLFNDVVCTNSSKQYKKEEEDWNELFENEEVSNMMSRCLAM